MKKLTRKLITMFGLIVTLMCTVTPTVFARVDLPTDLRPEYSPYVNLDKSAPNANEADYATFFLQLIAGGLLYLAAPVAVLVIAISGLRYVTAHGKQETLDGAKKTLVWAIVGLIVIILSFAIVRLIITTVFQVDQTPQQTTTTATPTTSKAVPGLPTDPS